jgi:hypothetical protein
MTEAHERVARTDECGATDGYSTCTNPLGHMGNVHWDKYTQHEWADDGD